MRHAARSLEIAELVVRYREQGVVGFDIAGAEAGFPPSRHLDAFQHIQRENGHFTIHAGEAFGLPSIWEALQWCNADRLGHGVRIVDDITADADGEPVLGRLAAYVRDKRIPLEMCPSSNVQTGAAPSIAEHPIGLLRRLSFRVTVNTDNRLMSGVSLSSEMSALVDAFGYGWDDLRWLTVNAMKSSFLPFDERLALIDTVDQAGLRRARVLEAVEHRARPGQAEPGRAGLDHRQRGRGVADPARRLDPEPPADGLVHGADGVERWRRRSGGSRCSVFTYWAPARSHARHASRTSSRVRAADSRITLSSTSPQACLTARTSASTASQRPALACPTSITMSTSTAPSATACAASAALTEEACAPDGKPTTVQTATVVCSGRRLGETQTENAPSSSASRHSAATCASVASGLSGCGRPAAPPSWPGPDLRSGARRGRPGCRTGPSRVAPASTIASAVAVSRMPPDALTPRRPPTVSCHGADGVQGGAAARVEPGARSSRTGRRPARTPGTPRGPRPA